MAAQLSCFACRVYIPHFLQGNLKSSQRRQVIAHLRQCDDCLRLAEEEKYVGRTPSSQYATDNFVTYAETPYDSRVYDLEPSHTTDPSRSVFPVNHRETNAADTPSDTDLEQPYTTHSSAYGEDRYAPSTDPLASYVDSRKPDAVHVTFGLEGGAPNMQDDVSSIQDDMRYMQGDVRFTQGDVSSVQGNVRFTQGDVSPVQGNVPSYVDDAPLPPAEVAPYPSFGRTGHSAVGDDLPLPYIRRQQTVDAQPPRGWVVIKWGVWLVLTLYAVSLTCFGYGLLTFGSTEERLYAWAELSFPLGKIGHKESDWTRWFPLYGREISYPLHAGVAAERRRIGTVTLKQQLWWQEIDVRLDQTDTLLRSSLKLPTEEKVNNNAEDTWNVLTQLPPAATVQLNFSTNSYLTPQALRKMLAPYDLKLLWIPVYSGEKGAETTQAYPLGLKLWQDSSGAVSLANSEARLREHLETVTAHPLRTGEQALWNRRKSYIRAHGIKTYGATVQGTPQALLQLQEVLELRAPTIVSID